MLWLGIAYGHHPDPASDIHTSHAILVGYRLGIGAAFPGKRLLSGGQDLFETTRLLQRLFQIADRNSVSLSHQQFFYGYPGSRCQVYVS